MKRVEIESELRKVHIEVAGVSMQYTAERSIYDAACFTGDGVLADNTRQRLHALTDRQLDLAQSLMVLTRRLVEAQE